MELRQSVTRLEHELAALEQRREERERAVRAPLAAEQAKLEPLERALADEEARLARFTAELTAGPPRPVLTWARVPLLAMGLGAFTFGAAAAPLSPPQAAMALFCGAWVAFLMGTLRGR